MKSFLIFLSGMMVTAIAAAAAFIFLAGQPAKDPAGGTPSLKEAEVLSPDDRFILSGTIEVPDELKSVIQSGKGKLIISLHTGPGASFMRPLTTGVLRPTFPYRFSFPLSKNELAGGHNVKDGLAIYVSYTPNEAERKTSWGNAHFEPTAVTFNFLPFSEQQILGRDLPEKYDVGKISFTRYFKQTVNTPCLSNTLLLAGKVVPTQRFMQEHGRDKFALLIYEDSANGKIGSDAHPETRIIHTQFMDFSSGASAFSVPLQRNRYPFYLVFGVKCEAGDTLPACVRRAFPFEPMRDQNKNRYGIMDSHREAAFCGRNDFVGIIDQANYLSPVYARVPEAGSREKAQ